MFRTDDSIATEEKRAALERALNSRALSRSEQLRAFLRYVCEADIAGRSREVNEYAIGVFALGRPENYSPAEDSCVRTRAYELRNKLRLFYETEAPRELLRIELPKGAYVPSFLRYEEARSVAPASADATRGLSAPELQPLWAPFVDRTTRLLLVFDVRLCFYSPATGLVVRDYRVNRPEEVANSQAFGEFQSRMGESELRETRDYADFGAVHAAFLLGQSLAGARVDVGLKHSMSVDWQDLWNNNVVFVGKTRGNPIVSSLLAERDFSVDDEGVIRNPNPRTGESTEYASAATHGAGEKHALITCVRGPNPRRSVVLLLCGGGAELMWALAESVTNPVYVSELLGLIRQPNGAYAEQFQVVVRAQFQSNVPVNIRFVAHRTF
jgi:hypothetical protein